MKIRFCDVSTGPRIQSEEEEKKKRKRESGWVGGKQVITLAPVFGWYLFTCPN